MKKFFGLMCCVVAIAAMAACGSTGNGGDGNKDGNKCGGGDNPMMNAMYDACKEAPLWWVSVHANPEAGQYWETKTKNPYQEYTETWQIAAIVDGNPIVEQKTQFGYILAYHVDLSVAEGGANVVKAWKGKPKGKPEELPLAKKPEPTGGEPGPSDWTSETKEEDFSDVEMGGGKWSGKKITITSKHKNGKDWSEIITWKANDSWFDGVIKWVMSSENAGNKFEMTKELTAFNSEGKPWLSWGE